MATGGKAGERRNGRRKSGVGGVSRGREAAGYIALSAVVQEISQPGVER